MHETLSINYTVNVLLGMGLRNDAVANLPDDDGEATKRVVVLGALPNQEQNVENGIEHLPEIFEVHLCHVQCLGLKQQQNEAGHNMIQTQKC